MSGAHVRHPSMDLLGTNACWSSAAPSSGVPQFLEFQGTRAAAKVDVRNTLLQDLEKSCGELDQLNVVISSIDLSDATVSEASPRPGRVEYVYRLDDEEASREAELVDWAQSNGDSLGSTPLERLREGNTVIQHATCSEQILPQVPSGSARWSTSSRSTSSSSSLPPPSPRSTLLAPGKVPKQMDTAAAGPMCSVRSSDKVVYWCVQPSGKSSYGEVPQSLGMHRLPALPLNLDVHVPISVPHSLNTTGNGACVHPTHDPATMLGHNRAALIQRNRVSPSQTRSPSPMNSTPSPQGNPSHELRQAAGLHAGTRSPEPAPGAGQLGKVVYWTVKPKGKATDTAPSSTMDALSAHRAPALSRSTSHLPSVQASVRPSGGHEPGYQHQRSSSHRKPGTGRDASPSQASSKGWISWKGFRG